VNKFFKFNPASTRAQALRRLFLAFAFLIVLVYAISIFQGWRGAINDTQASLKYISSLLAQATRSTFTSNELVLRGLGSELLSQGALNKPENGRALIERMKSIDPGVVGFGLARPDGQLVLVSGLKNGTPLPNLLANPSAKESFQKSLDTKSFQIGRPYFMSHLNNWVVPIRAPLLRPDGTVAAVMTSGYRIEGSSAAWSDLDVPQGMTIIMIRPDGYRILSMPLPPGDKSAAMNLVYGQPVAASTLERIKALVEPEGFGELFAPQLKAQVFYYYQKLPEYELLVGSMMPRQAVLVLWLERMVLPTILFLLVMIGGYFAYRRSVLQLEKSDVELAGQLRDAEYRALHDSLTGLANRTLLHQKFKQMTSELSQTERVGLFLFDLDHFKDINDTLGHQVGDKLLCEIGPRFEMVLQGRHFVISRLGGDEFVVLVSAVLEPEEWLALGQHLRHNLILPFNLEGMKLEISASVGVAIYPDHGDNSHELMRYADMAMYEAKRSGAGILRYEKIQNIHSLERLALMGSLGAAIDAGQLVLHYQPKLELVSGQVKGFEALVRWQHPELGLLYPDRFIPMAETSDVIHRLTLNVLKQALEQQQKWKAVGLHYTVAVNLSARNLVDDRLLIALKEMMQDSGIEKGELELEITESALMYDPEGALKLLHQFAALGVSLSIDDFGTGFSSMAYLRQMPVSTLKIDMLFVRNMLIKAEDKIIVSSMIALAHNLGMQVVAEGVEDEATRNALAAMGCEQIQGYFISKPKPWHELADWVVAKN
jgi:diguanylate cyclase (GGDEF)-like protein